MQRVAEFSKRQPAEDDEEGGDQAGNREPAFLCDIPDQGFVFPVCKTPRIGCRVVFPKMQGKMGISARIEPAL
jgi:hypothetical protein